MKVPVSVVLRRLWVSDLMLEDEPFRRMMIDTELRKISEQHGIPRSSLRVRFRRVPQTAEWFIANVKPPVELTIRVRAS